MFHVTMLTLQHALKHLRRNKCADSNGIVAECFAYGSLEFCEHLFCLPNLLLVHGHLDERKKQTTFSMIPETGDFTKPRNWRPLAILKNITIWPPIVHKRVGVWASNAHARTNMKTRKILIRKNILGYCTRNFMNSSALIIHPYLFKRAKPIVDAQ